MCWNDSTAPAMSTAWSCLASAAKSLGTVGTSGTSVPPTREVSTPVRNASSTPSRPVMKLSLMSCAASPRWTSVVTRSPSSRRLGEP